MVVISNTRGVSDNHSAQKDIPCDHNSICRERVAKCVSTLKLFLRIFIMVNILCTSRMNGKKRKKNVIVLIQSTIWMVNIECFFYLLRCL